MYCVCTLTFPSLPSSSSSSSSSLSLSLFLYLSPFKVGDILLNPDSLAQFSKIDFDAVVRMKERERERSNECNNGVVICKTRQYIVSCTPCDIIGSPSVRVNVID